MSLRFRIRPIDLMAACGLATVFVWHYAATPRDARPAGDGFSRQVQLEPLYRTAVQADGRLRSFESHAKSYMGYVSGPRQIRGQSNGFTYLDLIFRPERYQDLDLVYIKNKLVRKQLVAVLREHGLVDEPRAQTMLKRGLIARTLLRRPEVLTLLRTLGEDLIRTARSVDEIQSALAVSDPRFLLDSLRVIAPPGGELERPWVSISHVIGPTAAPFDDVHAQLFRPAEIEGLNPAIQKKIADAWRTLQTAWRNQDAPTVNEQIETLAGLFPQVSGHLYPSPSRLAMESWYFRYHSMTWVWLIYLAAVIPLLMSVIYRWDWARRTGIVLFVIAFLFQTASLLIRWYISGRWPNANMFEAVTTAAWFGAVGTLILEGFAKTTPFRNLFALGSAVISMTALMAAYFLPAYLDSSISNKMAALNDVWIYIHTNVIIWSYAVIGLACVPALLLLRHRWCLAWDAGRISKGRLLILPVALVTLNYTAYRLLMHAMDDPGRALSTGAFLGVLGAFCGSLMIVFLEATAAWARGDRRFGSDLEPSAGGGASSMILGSAAALPFLKNHRPAFGQILDGATMVLVEVAFVMLWAGTIMGAIWADHSWGRPWGWDPKEVFALNTFIVFLILIHVRLKVRDKAFWTAVLAVVGFEVMLFNWIVVNFVITGLHSYA